MANYDDMKSDLGAMDDQDIASITKHGQQGSTGNFAASPQRASQAGKKGGKAKKNKSQRGA